MVEDDSFAKRCAENDASQITVFLNRLIEDYRDSAVALLAHSTNFVSDSTMRSSFLYASSFNISINLLAISLYGSIASH